MKPFAVLSSLLLIMVAGAMGGAPDRKYVVVNRTGVAVNAPYSEAVLTGNTLYVAGHIGIDPATGKPGATPEEEAKLVMELFKRDVEAGGMTMDDLVSVTVFCSDLSQYNAFNNVYRTYFHQNYPARAFIGSGKLLFDARFEVQGIAVKRAVGK
jgi:2-iminobutanoate/2-iminopropanoate deaminase